MIDTVLNLLVRCSHRRLTRPMTPVSRSGQPHGETYVVCLDCGKQFAYDVRNMRIGKALDRLHDAGPPSPKPPRSRKKNLVVAIFAAVPAAFMLGAVLRRGKEKAAPAPEPTPDPVPPEHKIDAKT
jgi:hypothetical protein